MKALKNFGNHVQYSVFECELKDHVYQRMRAQLDQLIAPKEDNVRFYFLDEDMIKRIEVIGTRQVRRMADVYLLGFDE